MAASEAAAAQLLQEFQQVQSHRAQLYAKFNAGFRDYVAGGQEAAFARLTQQLTPAFNAVSKQVIHIEACLKSSAVDRADLANLLRKVQELERNKLRFTLSWQALRAAHAAGQFSWQAEADRPTIRHRHLQEQQQQQQHLQSMLQELQLAQSSAAATPGSSGYVFNSLDRPDQKLGQADGFMSVKPGFYEQQLQQATTAAAAAAQQHSHQHHGCCGHDDDHGEHDPLDCNELEPTEVEYTAAVKEALQELDACVVGINEVLEEVTYALQELTEEVEG